MAVILSPGIAEIRLKGTQNGETWNAVQHGQCFIPISPIGSSDLLNLLNSWAGFASLVTALEAVTNPDFTWDEVSVRDLGVVGAASISAPVTMVGTTVGDVSNSATSARIYWEIGNIPTFKRKGWIDVPGVLDANSVANVLTSGALTSYADVAIAIQSATDTAHSGAGFWTPVVLSKFFGSGGGTPGHPVPHPRPTGVATPIIGFTVRPKVAGRSDRLRGGRRHR